MSNKILDDRYYRIFCKNDAAYLMQSLHLDALKEVPKSATEVYSHSQCINSKFESDARKANLSVEDYSIKCKQELRNKILDMAVEYDLHHTQYWVVLHATHDNMSFKVYHCFEEILRDLMCDEFDMYLEDNGKCRIIKSDGIYVLYRMTEVGYARYRVAITKKKYADPELQFKYVMELMFSSRDNMTNAGYEWYRKGDLDD